MYFAKSNQLETFRWVCISFQILVKIDFRLFAFPMNWITIDCIYISNVSEQEIKLNLWNWSENCHFRSKWICPTFLQTRSIQVFAMKYNLIGFVQELFWYLSSHLFIHTNKIILKLATGCSFYHQNFCIQICIKKAY